MKKIILAALLVVFVCSSQSHATINVTWNWDESAATGIYLSDGVTLLPVGSIVQLIFTLDALVAPIDISNPLSMPVGDSLIAQAAMTDAGFYFLGPANYGALGEFIGGFVYQRIFTADLSEYGLGTGVYGASPSDTATAEGSTVFSFLYDSATDPGLGSGFTMTVVPEPSVLAFLGLGGLALAARRRFVA